MIRYSHYIIAHGKAIAECLAEGMRRVKAEINRRIALHSANIGA